MPFLALGLRTGVKYICIRSEFSPERSNMIKLYGELAEHPIWVAVQYSEVSGNIAFKLPLLQISFRPGRCADAENDSEHP